MSEEHPDDEFVVIDKRAASGATDSAPEAGTPPLGEPRAEAGAGRVRPAAQSPPSDGSASPAPVDFTMLVQPFFVASLFHMGLAVDPETGQPGARNLPLARHNIDILEVIAAKTRGNLDAEEQQLLEGVLYELKMSFVKVGKASGA